MYGYGDSTNSYALANREPSEPLLDVIHYLNTLPQASRVLNLGCGDGMLERMAGSMRPYRFVSLDIEATAIKHLRNTLETYQQQDVAFIGDITKPETLENRGEPYAVAVSWRVLHGIHPKHYDKIISQIYHWLKPGGRLFLSVAADSDWKVTALGKNYNPSGVNDCSGVMFEAFGVERTHPFPIHFFSKDELSDLGKRHHFTPITVGEFHETSGFSHLRKYVSTYYFAEFIKTP